MLAALIWTLLLVSLRPGSGEGRRHGGERSGKVKIVQRGFK
jgi:hypothetical protein